MLYGYAGNEMYYTLVMDYQGNSLGNFLRNSLCYYDYHHCVCLTITLHDKESSCAIQVRRFSIVPVEYCNKESCDDIIQNQLTININLRLADYMYVHTYVHVCICMQLHAHYIYTFKLSEDFVPIMVYCSTQKCRERGF